MITQRLITQRFICMALNAALCVTVAGLAGCNQQPTAATSPASSSSSAPAPAGTAAQAPLYTPPSADDLYQMVAPIALFPDKLVAQLLAGSTYPDQVTAADNFLAQNQNLQGPALQDQVDPQAWDPSIKGLTVFPKVLDQMAQNLPWTTSLGEAYVNDPTDVLNAIQVMRERASKHGSLRSSARMRVVDQPVAQAVSYTVPADGYPPVYSGPSVVPAPQQSIEILSAEPDTVYVPNYDPQTVYGEEVPVYPGYSYERPVYDGHSDGYSGSQVVTAGVISFGVGILVGALLENSHHDRGPSYGWNSWGMNWGGDRNGYGGRGHGDGGGWQRPAVVHNDTTYVSRSTTVVNHYVTNNINNSVNNSVNNSNNRYIDNRNKNGGNSPNPMAVARLHAQDNRATAVVPLVTPPARNHAAELSHPGAMIARTPATRPDFSGALTKGEPARFSHVGAGNQVATPMRRGAAVTPAASPLAGNRPAARMLPRAIAAHAPPARLGVDSGVHKGEMPHFSRSGVESTAAVHAQQGVHEQRPASPTMQQSHAVPHVESVLRHNPAAAEPAHQPAAPATLPATQEIRRATEVDRPTIEQSRPQPVRQQTSPRPVERQPVERSQVERSVQVTERPRAMPRQEAPVQPRREAPVYRETPRPREMRQPPAARPSAAPAKKEPTNKREKKSDDSH
ncbi:MAG: DUF3300 domain-containing protein [Rhodanobacter sp.]